jgi:hypothetical protein
MGYRPPPPPPPALPLCKCGHEEDDHLNYLDRTKPKYCIFVTPLPVPGHPELSCKCLSYEASSTPSSFSTELRLDKPASIRKIIVDELPE